MEIETEQNSIILKFNMEFGEIIFPNMRNFYVEQIGVETKGNFKPYKI